MSGSGAPARRGGNYVDDLADACIHPMKNYSSDELVNIGTGKDIAVGQFARVVAAVVGYSGEISFDTSRPDGTPRNGSMPVALPNWAGVCAPPSP
jgi:GDP-L-fucose synthase